MTRLGMVSSKQLVKILLSIGFRVEHQKGSHAFFQHPDGRATVVPIHRGEDIVAKDPTGPSHEAFRIL